MFILLLKQLFDARILIKRLPSFSVHMKDEGHEGCVQGNLAGQEAQYSWNQQHFGYSAFSFCPKHDPAASMWQKR